MSLRAWRFWRLTLDARGTARLWSIYVSCPWEGPLLHAHERPARHNEHCGIYALREVVWRLHNTIAPAPPGHTLLGLIGGYCQLWGRVVVHEAGYRAEHAMLEALVATVVAGSGSGRVIDVDADVLFAVQRHYGVELLPFGSRKRFFSR